MCSINSVRDKKNVRETRLNRVYAVNLKTDMGCLTKFACPDKI